MYINVFGLLKNSWLKQSLITLAASLLFILEHHYSHLQCGDEKTWCIHPITVEGEGQTSHK